MHNRRCLTRSLRQAQIAIVATGGRAMMSIGLWGGQRCGPNRWRQRATRSPTRLSVWSPFPRMSRKGAIVLHIIALDRHQGRHRCARGLDRVHAGPSRRGCRIAARLASWPYPAKQDQGQNEIAERSQHLGAFSFRAASSAASMGPERSGIFEVPAARQREDRVRGMKYSNPCPSPSRSVPDRLGCPLIEMR